MDASLLAPVAVRWIHVISAVLLVGGLGFMAFVVLPAVGADRSEDLRRAIRGRWAKLVMISSGLLLLSGLYNFMTIGVAKGREVGAYHMLFGIKFLLALAVMFFASALAGRSAAFEKLRARSGYWYVVTAFVAVVVLMLSGLMKNLG